jgi:glycosyltransferase involved in cell wall biosynthesis
VSERGLSSLAVFHLGGVGGPQRSLVGAMSWLRDQGSVEFIVPEDGATAEIYGALGPVSVHDYSVLTYARGIRAGVPMALQLARDVRFFRRELRRRQPDLVVAVTTVLPALLVAARMERIPAVVYAAELYRQEWKGAPMLRLWGALLARVTSWLADGIVCCSAHVAGQFGARRGKPIAIAYPPIGCEYAGGDRDAARARYGLEAAHPCLVVAGNISRGRGQDVAVRALSRILRRLPGARLLILGAPHTRSADLAFADELRRLAAAIGVEDAVVFAEPTDAMADVYAAGDIVLNPARFEEPFGRVAAEALLAGRPPVASRVGAVPEVIRDGVDGLLVPPNDPYALADAVERLVEEPGLRERLTASGRRRVLDEFGPAQDLAAWREVLDSVVVQPPPRT